MMDISNEIQESLGRSYSVPDDIDEDDLMDVDLAPSSGPKGGFGSWKQILDDIDSQMVGTLSGADFDAEIRASVVNEVNE